MKHLDVSYNVHGNGLFQLSALQPFVNLIHQFPSTSPTPLSVYPTDESAVSADSILNMQLRELNISLLNVLLAVHYEDIDALYVFEQGNNAQINGSSAGDLLVGSEQVNNTFYGGLGNDVMIGHGGANTYAFDIASVNDQEVERDIITDFNLNNGDKLLFTQDIFNGGADPLEQQVHASSISEGGITGTLLSITQPGNGEVIHEILLMNYTPAILPPLTEMIQVA